MNHIRTYREKKGLTLKELAEKVGVHGSAVSQWEKGTKTPRINNRKKLAEVLGCQPEDLFPDTGISKDVELVAMTQREIIPIAHYSGVLPLADRELECYVLDTGDRVITLNATVKSISGQNHSNLGEYLSVQALDGYIDTAEILSRTIYFDIPNSGFNIPARGITAETFIEICDAYVAAHENGSLASGRQIEMAIQCSALLRACAKVGLIALIDETTGYQFDRARDALQVKLRAFILEELRAWEKTFPDELWEEFGRLTSWSNPLHSRPKWWGKLVMELVYDALDPDVANHLRTNMPPPRHGQNYHQWLTENYGLRQLITHIYQIIGVAKTCNDMSELRYKVGLHYGKVPVQTTFYFDNDSEFSVKR